VTFHIFPFIMLTFQFISNFASNFDFCFANFQRNELMVGFLMFSLSQYRGKKLLAARTASQSGTQGKPPLSPQSPICLIFFLKEKAWMTTFPNATSDTGGVLLKLHTQLENSSLILLTKRLRFRNLPHWNA